MRYRRVGRWGLGVSAVSLGSWLTLGQSVGREESGAIVRRAFDLGVNLFDTANSYGEGAAEKALGRAIAGLPRDELVIGTKLYNPMGPGPNDRGLSRLHVLRQCDASLQRLGVDRIDLYQCHRYDPETPLDETCRAMDHLIRQGKVVYWGISEWTPEQIEGAVTLCARDGLYPPVANQPRYSLLQRGIEDRVMGVCARLGVGLVTFSPLARGVLTGKYLGGEAPLASRGADPKTARLVDDLLTPDAVAVVGRLRAAAAEAGCTPAQLAIAWVLRRPEVSSALTGASRPEQVTETAAAADLEVDPALWGRHGLA